MMTRTNASTRLPQVVIAPDSSLAAALVQLEQAATKILLVCDAANHLRGILTDGDIRRALLRHRALESPCAAVANQHPLVASPDVSDAEALRLMDHGQGFAVDQLPLVDAHGRAVGLLLRQDLDTPPLVERFAETCIAPDAPISAALAQLDTVGTGMLLLCRTDQTLQGVLTDGDVRRSVLGGMTIDTACAAIASPHPLTGPAQLSRTEALWLMDHGCPVRVDQLPLVDHSGVVVGLVLRRDLVASRPRPLSAMVMAGGFGTRLHPLTAQTPKPMLPVGDRPLLARTIERLRFAGVQQVHITTHYLEEQIVGYFGNGQDFGVDLRYVSEQQPLGTAGALGLVEFADTLLLMNGDILTEANFERMLSYHREHRAAITIGIRQHTITVPYGVVECSNVQVTAIREKPSIDVFINAGIYLLEPSVRRCIPPGQRCDMPDLIHSVIDSGGLVVGFPIVEYWLDIGQHADYERAQEDVRNGTIGSCSERCVGSP